MRAIVSGKIAIVGIDPYRCIGYGVCVQSCPKDVIRVKRGKAHIAYQDDCSACFACETDFLRKAISLGLISQS